MIKDLCTFDTHLTPITTIQEIKKQEETLINLLLLHLDKLDIASAMFTSPILLDEYSQTYYKCSFETLQDVFSARSNATLLDKQFEKALMGSEKLLIFLGKNYAKQVDSGDKALMNAETIILTDTAIGLGDIKEETIAEENLQENIN